MQHWKFPLPTGAKTCIRHNPGMDQVLDTMLYAEDGMLSVSDIKQETDIPGYTVTRYLLILKQYGIVGNTYAKKGDSYKLWWIVPALRNNLTIFVQALRTSE